MPGFDEVWPRSGLDTGASPPFIAMPRGQFRLVYFQTATGTAVPSGNGAVEVVDATRYPPERLFVELTRSDLLGRFIAKFLSLIAGDSLSRARNGKRLLVIKGKTVGIARLKGLEVAVVTPKTRTLSFKYVHYLDPEGNAQGTTRKPGDAPALVTALDDVFGVQAGVKFELKKAEDLPISVRMGPKVNDAIYEAHLKSACDPGADVTVFMVGRYEHSNGRTKGAGKGWAILVPDNPDRFHADVDPFVNALAHELGHTLGASHSARSDVLMTDAEHGVTSLKISADTIKQIHGL
jgi:hypothetical protein